MKNKGFVFIETIVTVLVLSTSLLYLYNSYNNIIDKEETRVYYDDVAYIYKTNYIKRFLEENANIEYVKSEAFKKSYVTSIGNAFDNFFNEAQLAENMNNSLENIGNDFENFFYELQVNEETNEARIIEDLKKSLENILNNFRVNQMFLVKRNYIDECDGSETSGKCYFNATDNAYNLTNYIKSINDTKHDYYLVVEYSEKVDSDGKITKCTPRVDTNCRNYFVSLGL